MHIFICDDDRIFADKFAELVKEELHKHQIDTDIHTFLSASALTDAFQKKQPCDILFLDIDMPETNGIDLAVSLKAYEIKPYLIFVSTVESLVYQTFKVNPFWFIRKRFCESELPEVITALLADMRIHLLETITLNCAHSIYTLHPLSYTISYLWPADLLPDWNMIYVIRALCILVLSVLMTWILIKLGRLLIKITDPFFLCLITVCALGLNIADIYLGAIMNSMFILNITYTLLVIIFLLIFLLIGESSRHQAENQRLLFQQEIENSYRNYIFELEEMSQQIRLFRHEYQGKLLLMKTLLKKQDYQTLDQELQDMLEDIPTAEQLVTSGNVLENNPDLKTTKSNPSYHGYGIRLIRQIAEKYNGAADFSATKESFICRVMLTLDGVDEEKNTPV